ncbi:Crp/Fnr family transcriptional regulator [Sediminitomix flava]|uniref:CRP-like cAMP-binding protein n=1 Tax=Sediminitomix flava TaxID=379075 RepID=A0A315ZH88_SEDFL|nr:Crp/Fnr family transcriptional regulator [Sediminitomix flava]PWJ44946.1 CRP-like cAMP-binding protein [Sediminitomix flava]
MEVLKQEIEKYTQFNSVEEWNKFSSKLTIKEAKKREVIFRETDICDKVIYILDGIVSSEYNRDDKQVISRFFQKGNLCSNMISAFSKTIQSDNVIAITSVKYITIPYEYFMELYLYSDSIGVFLRKKILEHLVEAKNFISIKTTANTETEYAFLEEYYPEIIRKTPSKYIAAFIGITPEALSRFLKQRHSS